MRYGRRVNKAAAILGYTVQVLGRAPAILKPDLIWAEPQIKYRELTMREPLLLELRKQDLTVEDDVEPLTLLITDGVEYHVQIERKDHAKRERRKAAGQNFKGANLKLW